MSDRTYDLVLLGATGFTGGLVAEDLTAQLGAGELRWAIAGRDRAKLTAVRDRLTGAGDGQPDGIEVVDVHEPAEIRALAASTRVLATTVGPYEQHGEPVVAACVDAHTDYLDITGEPTFVNRILERYDAAAREAGVRIVNCCGFDSIPHDLGAQFTVEQLPEDVPLRVAAYVSAGGRPSGGTLASALGIIASPSTAFGWTRPDPGAGRRIGGLPRKVRPVPEISGWAAPLPTIDPQVVLRSAAALPRYGPDFRYGHYVRFPNLPVTVGAIGGVAAVAGLAQLRAGRALLDRLTPDSGEGPGPERRAKGWFRVTFLGEGGGASVRTEVRGGDPGYTETSRMLSEAARSLLSDGERLPDVAGVVTPAVAFGAVLRQRLQARGMTFEVVDG